MKKTLFAALLLCSLLSPLSHAQAMTVRGGEQFMLPASEAMNDDLYVGAATLIINGNINGDLIGGGGNVTINGNISEDAIVGGGNLSLLGEVGDDVRMGAGSAVIGKNVKGDVLFAGGTLYILKDAIISGDIALAGGSIVIDGTVKGKSFISADSITINGSLEGEVEIYSGTNLNFGPTATVLQPIKHQGMAEAVVAEGARVGKIDFTKIEDSREQTKNIDSSTVAGIFAGIFGIFFIIQLISLLVVALLAATFMQPLVSRLVDESLSDPMVKLTRGTAWFFLVPLLFIILLVTIIGSGVAMVVAPVYFLSIALAKVLAGIVFGVWIMRLSSKKEVAIDWKPVTLGVIALEILSVIPFIGWLIGSVVFLLALGGLYSYLTQRLKAIKK